MITIWCRRRSTGAKLLIEKLQELGHTARLVIGGRCPPSAIVWGRGGGNKFNELCTLRNAGIPVPNHGLGRPLEGEWLRRSFTHMGARDLLRGSGQDYYVERLDINKEYRFHIYNGESIRRQVKVPRIPNPHPWIRSWRSGWKLVPGGDATTEMREASKRAVAALGYTFGAVDIGRLQEGGFVVLEVNTAPGIEGGTVTKYATTIIQERQRG